MARARLHDRAVRLQPIRVGDLILHRIEAVPCVGNMENSPLIRKVHTRSPSNSGSVPIAHNLSTAPLYCEPSVAATWESITPKFFLCSCQTVMYPTFASNKSNAHSGKLRAKYVVRHFLEYGLTAGRYALSLTRAKSPRA